MERAAFATMVVLAALLAGGLIAIAALGEHGARPPASPTATDVSREDGFPRVDWSYWLGVNPDIVGWITIPGTKVDHPIARAPANDPAFYLTHDVYGTPNYTGCPYLDAECMRQGGLLRCPNSVVFGHNMEWNDEVFGQLAGYSNPGFASLHREVLLQEPGGTKHRLRVRACEVVPGWTEAKRIDFADSADFQRWWRERHGSAAVQLPLGDASAPLLTLCTCSYTRWSDERTIVYCQ